MSEHTSCVSLRVSPSHSAEVACMSSYARDCRSAVQVGARPLTDLCRLQLDFIAGTFAPQPGDKEVRERERVALVLPWLKAEASA